MKKTLVFCLIFAIFLAGCGKKTPHRTAVVSQISATADRDGYQIRKIYTSSHKMSQILNTIRTLGQKTTATVDPDTIPGDSLRIVLSRSDGSSLTYRTKCGKYFRRADDHWQEADTEQLSELDRLIRDLPSDQN